MTDSDNIDWDDKRVLDINKLKEVKMSKTQIVMVLNRGTKEISKIMIKDIDLKNHHIIFGDKRWVPLHKI